jgi:arylsulfatase A-like enzyme
LVLDPRNPLPYGARPPRITAEQQAREYELIGDLNRLAGVEYPEDDGLRARIRSYELAFRMQMAVPEALDLAKEPRAIRNLYGLDEANTKLAGERLLAARRLVERGVRFVQVYPSPYGAWDSHQKLRENHARLCPMIDRPIAGLLRDLKQRGLWNDVTVVFCTEFGRTPGLEQRAGGTTGRDHHPHGFTVWLAGAGIKGGTVYGATDELGFHALEPGRYVTDLHATVLRLLGLDSRKLEVPGRKRLEIDHGRVIEEVLA